MWETIVKAGGFGDATRTVGLLCAGGGGLCRDETFVAVGYSLRVTGSLAITPLVQIIADPAQNPHDGLFVLAGLRAVYVF